MPFALTCRAGTLSIDIPFCHGEMTEWPIVPDSKSGVPVTVPGVQIPLSPKYFLYKRQVFSKLRICLYFYNGTPFCNYLIFSVLNLQKGTVDITKRNFNPFFVKS